ncbi:MAG TPA: hypothetical protein VIL95_07335, partial [Bacillota bacterium]
MSATPLPEFDALPKPLRTAVLIPGALALAVLLVWLLVTVGSAQPNSQVRALGAHAAGSTGADGWEGLALRPLPVAPPDRPGDDP